MGWFNDLLSRNRPIYEREADRRYEMATELISNIWMEYLPLPYNSDRSNPNFCPLGLQFAFTNENYQVYGKVRDEEVTVVIESSEDKCLAKLTSELSLIKSENSNPYGFIRHAKEFPCENYHELIQSLYGLGRSTMRWPMEYGLFNVNPKKLTIVTMPFPDTWYGDLMPLLIDFKARNRTRINDLIEETKAKDFFDKHDMKLDIDGLVIQTEEEYEDDMYRRKILNEYEEAELSKEFDPFQFDILKYEKRRNIA